MQHTEIPHALDDHAKNIYDMENLQKILEPGDKVIYATLRRFMNKETRECFPSILTIKQILKCGQTRIYQAINRLEKCGFLKISKKLLPSGKWSKMYSFPKNEWDEHFEMFTNEFLDLDIPLNIKEYYMTLQRFLLGKEANATTLYCYYNNTKLSELTGLSNPTIKKYNTWLIENNYLTEEVTSQKDEAGLPIISRNFNLAALNQAALWVKAVTEQVNKNTEDIDNMKDEITRLKEQLAALQKERALERNHTSPLIEFEM